MAEIKDTETLLELYREFTDKEKVNWLIKDYRILERKFRRLCIEMENLKTKNAELKKKIKADEEDIPSKFNGQTTVSAKAYWKLKRRCDMFEERVWELVQERNKLTNNSDCEKL